MISHECAQRLISRCKLMIVIFNQAKCKQKATSKPTAGMNKTSDWLMYSGLTINVSKRVCTHFTIKKN